MLYILSAFTYPIILLGIENEYIIRFFFKLPLLLSDISIFYILFKLFNDKYFKIIIFYFSNPIILYSTYIHSQLDIIPTALVLFSLFWLIKKHINISAFTLGLAISTKAHVLLIIPLVFLYIFKIYSLKKSLMYIAITCSVFLFFDLAYLFSDGFIAMVIENKKQALIFDSYYTIGELKIFLPLFSTVLVLSHFFNQKKVNIDLLFFYIGIMFTSIIFFVTPAPAWYVWIIPFLSIYFINNDSFNQSLVLFTVLNTLYLIFFILFYQSSYASIIMLNEVVDIKIYASRLMNISYTLLEACLAATLLTFYKYGIKSNNIYKKTTNTTIGIAGDSGAGKTALLYDISLLLGNRLIKLEGDGEHKWERGHSNWNNFTHLNPKANHIHNQADLIFELKHNNTIKRSDYNHHSGKFTSPERLKPKDFISLSGLHPFYLPSMRIHIDLKIYMDTDERLRRHWKILRDTQTRGYTLDDVIEKINERAEDSKKYIYPQKQFANIILRYYAISEFEIGNEYENIDIGLKIIFNADIHVEYIFEQIDDDFIWDYNEDLKTQYIDFKHEPNANFKILANRYIQNLNEIIDSQYQWLNGYKGLVQLIILLSLSEIMKGNSNEI